MLTTAQLQLIKAAIIADPELSAQPNTSGGAFAIAVALNQIESPDFIVWRSNINLDQISQSDTFAWTEVDSLSVGKARIWEWMFKNSTNSIDPSKSNVRAGISNCWTGTAAKTAVGVAILDMCKRSATRAEKILATGTGSSASPALLGFEGELTSDDVQQARELP